jgi:hypothetical protein
LQADLAATTRAWKVVFFHHPISCGNYHGSDSSLIDARADFRRQRRRRDSMATIITSSALTHAWHTARQHHHGTITIGRTITTSAAGSGRSVGTSCTHGARRRRLDFVRAEVAELTC